MIQIPNHLLGFIQTHAQCCNAPSGPSSSRCSSRATSTLSVRFSSATGAQDLVGPWGFPKRFPGIQKGFPGTFPESFFFSRNRLGRENANTSSHFELPRGFPEPSRKPKINSRMVPGTTPGGPCQPEEEQSGPCQPEGEQTQVYRRVRKRTKHAPVSFRDSPNKLRVAGCSLLYRLRVSLTIESCWEPPSFLL